jgi:hypothetical protein
VSGTRASRALGLIMSSFTVHHARSFSERLEEADRLSNGNARVNMAASRLNADLRSRNIDYVIIGGIALRAHGYLRYTDNLDIVLTTEGMDRFRKELLGRGGLGMFGYDAISRDGRAVSSYPEQAIVTFKIAGEYPGDGQPKPVSFPEPFVSSIEIEGASFATLEKLIELKLASGLTAPDRLKDLADIQELIKVRRLPRELAADLNPYVREKYLELWDAVQHGSTNDFEEQ